MPTIWCATSNKPSIAPGERHWHGASADGRMVHVALNVDASTTWLEKVSEREYQGR